jgi:fibronectin type 3 domain-containing protein
MRGTPHFVRAFIAEVATLQANKFLLTIAATLCIISACISLTAHAAQVQLDWDLPTISTGLAGYKVYYGQATTDYDVSEDAGLSTTATLSGLEAGRTYYFAVTAYDTAAQESDFSNEVSMVIPSDDFSLTASPTTVAAGGALSVSWTAPSGQSPTDWIGLYRTGAANTDYLWWTYTDGAASGTATLAAPTTAGTYVFRYLLDDGYKSVKTSNRITVK